MGRISIALLLLTGFVGGEPDIAEIATVMEAREKASRPFFIEYEIRDVRKGGTYWINTFSGWHYEDEQTLIRRLEILNLIGGPQGQFDKSKYAREDAIWIARQGMVPVYLRKPVEASPREWRGVRAATLQPANNGRFTPAHFGLVCMGAPGSAYLRRDSAKIEGRERIGQFDCIRVSLKWVNSKPPLPLVLWLSEKHDFYPVRTVLYVHVDRNDRYVAPAEDFVYENERYAPRSEFRVDKLERAGAAWLPAAGRSPVLFADGPGMVTYTASKIECGASAAEHIDMAGLARANVIDQASGLRYVVGSGDGGVPRVGRVDLIPSPLGRTIGLKIAPAPRGRTWVQFLIASIAMIAGLIGFLLWWRKQARVTPAAGTGSRTPPRE